MTSDPLDFYHNENLGKYLNNECKNVLYSYVCRNNLGTM